MDKISSTSLDLTNANIEKLKKLFPNIVTEGKVDYGKLKLLLGDEVDNNKEKYQFTWPGKSQAIKMAQTPSSATLRPDVKSSKNWDTTKNLYIEGDNLEVLKQLQKTYYGKIKVIYIDPPYNTGKDFVYRDNFKNSIDNYIEQTQQMLSSNPESNGRFHTDWLNMIYPRLLLARNLLSEDGLIFISIDDNEETNLMKICMEIFGEDNFIENYIWESTFRPDNSSKINRKNAEFVLCFAKNKRNIQRLIGGKSMSDGLPSLTKNSMKESTLYFKANTVDTFLSDGFYARGDKGAYYLHDDVEVRNGKIISPFSLTGRVIWGQTYLEEQMKNGTQIIIKNESFVPYTKKAEPTIQSPNKILPDNVVGDVLQANAERSSLFGNKKVFDYPKPVSLIKYLISFIDDNEFIVLDFFSGSSTTAHSVLKQNLEDDGQRKFIMVQLPELCSKDSVAFSEGYKNICEVGKERIKRAGEQIKSEWQNQNNSLFSVDKEFPYDIGFKVFKLDSTNIKPWDNEIQMDSQSLFNLSDVFKEGRSKEDVLYEIMLKYGVFDMQATEIEVNGKTMYRVGKRYMIVCLEDNITSKDIEAIGELSPRTVIFKEAGFNNDNDKINAVYNLEKAGVEDVKCI